MSRKVAYCAVLMALAMIFSYVEVLIPVHIGIPGIKLGLANLVVVAGFALLSPLEVFLISLGRIVLTSLLFGTGLSMLYSLAGGLLSYIVMLLLYQGGRRKKKPMQAEARKGFSLIGVSIAGGAAHNIGQLFVAAVVVENLKIFVYLPVLLAAGTITGMLIGIVASKIVPALKKAFAGS